MCIIGIKSSGKEAIDKATLQHCWDNNGDGAGFAVYNEDEKNWEVEKGFMTFKSFYKAIKARNFSKRDFYIVHFRFGTSGLTDGGNTHPFPIFSDLEDMRKTKFTSEHVAFHNGSCGVGNVRFSDTMLAIDFYVNPIWESFVREDPNKDKLYSILADVLDAETIRSRWLLTNGENYYMMGKGWETDAKGIEWSNNMYKSTVVKFRNPNYRAPHSAATSTSKGTFVTPSPGQKRFRDGKWQKKQGAAWVDDDEFNKSLETTSGSRSKSWEEEVKDLKSKFKLDSIGRLIIGNSLDACDLSRYSVTNTGKIIWEETADQVLVSVMCPTCYQDEDFKESEWSGTDLVCKLCGAAFCKDTGDVVLIDPEYENVEVEGAK